MAIAPIRKQYTNTRSFVEGFETRLIFSMNTHSTINIPYTGNLADPDFFLSISPDNYRGNMNAFPANYFYPGRMLRIQGCFFYSSSGSTSLDSTFGFVDGSSTFASSTTNNTNVHTFANGETHSAVPVFINLMANCTGEAMQLSGHLIYNYDSYNSGGPNVANAVVPFYPAETIIDWNSAIVPKFYIGPETVEMQYLTIEELG